MSQYHSAREIAELWHITEATVRWYAHRDRWERTDDRKRPVLYRVVDVEKTMDRRLDRSSQTNDHADMLGEVSTS